MIFVGYDKSDERWVRRLSTIFTPLIREGTLSMWTNDSIQAGNEWRKDIEIAIKQADFVILMVSPSFLESEFLNDFTVPAVLKENSVRGLPISWLPLASCFYDYSPIEKYQPLHPPEEPFEELPQNRVNTILTQCAKKVTDLLESPESVTRRQRQIAKRKRCEDSDELFRLYDLRAKLIDTQRDTREVTQKIISLKRKLRDGPTLGEDDLLLEGRFRLLSSLGKGGFAQVWKAYDQQRDKIVALKVLHGHHAGEANVRERFFRGARQMASLNHPGIVEVYDDYLQDDVYYFYSMEYLSGGDLAQRVADGNFSSEIIIGLITQVGEALAFTNEKGMIHRDIKPNNILFDKDGRVKLTDFDLVHAFDTTGGTKTGANMGSFIYAAPELSMNAAEATAQADVYGLAMSCIFALYGKPLDMWAMRSPQDVLERAGVSRNLQVCLLKGVNWNLNERFQSVKDFLKSLQGGWDFSFLTMDWRELESQASAHYIKLIKDLHNPWEHANLKRSMYYEKLKISRDAPQSQIDFSFLDLNWSHPEYISRLQITYISYLSEHYPLKDCIQISGVSKSTWYLWKARYRHTSDVELQPEREWLELNGLKWCFGG